jgi:hypothetical protein
VSALLSQTQRWLSQPLPLALLHLLGLGLTARLAHWPYPAVAAVLALTLLPFALYARTGRQPAGLSPAWLLASLAPLFILYRPPALPGLLHLPGCP